MGYAFVFSVTAFFHWVRSAKAMKIVGKLGRKKRSFCDAKNMSSFFATKFPFPLSAFESSRGDGVLDLLGSLAGGTSGFAARFNHDSFNRFLFFLLRSCFSLAATPKIFSCGQNQSSLEMENDNASLSISGQSFFQHASSWRMFFLINFVV